VGPRTLLVADDEPAHRELIRMIVEDTALPIRLVTARDGEEAVARAREVRPRLVLMDLMMPVVDGWEATRRLKADPATRDIRVIALTAHELPGDAARALAAGCDAYITKPIEVPALRALLERYFR
jgi:two-component system cell cycle response regulator DivK